MPPPISAVFSSTMICSSVGVEFIIAIPPPYGWEPPRNDIPLIVALLFEA